MTSLDLNVFVSNKRQKTRNDAKDLSEFAKGTIIRVKLKNFMSCALTEFHFGPHMNFIIGPNGSGKSTFVCAICIGLCGKLDNLGKASMTTDQFIRSGYQEGFVEIELKGDGDSTVVVKRDLFEGKKSNWFLNGRVVNEKAIKKLLEEMNIQLDNLCQFLPQDRVAKFPALKPEDLLMEIERSYGNGELLAQHQKLNTLFAEKQGNEKEINDITKELDNLKFKNVDLTSKVEEFNTFVELTKKVAKYKNLIPMAKLHTLKAEQLKKKENIDRLNASIRDFDNKYSNIRSALESYQGELGAFDEKITSLKRSQGLLLNQVQKNKNQIPYMEKQIETLRQERRDLELEASKNKTAILKLKKEYQNTWDDMKKIQLLDPEEYKELENRRDELHESNLQLGEEIKEKQDDYNAIKRKLTSLEEKVDQEKKKLSSKDKLDSLDYNRERAMIDAVRFLRRNEEKYKLKGLWFEPPILSLDFKNLQYATALEKVVKYQDLRAITVLGNEAYKKVADILQREARVNVSLRTLIPGKKYNSPLSSNEIMKMGFDGFLSDFLTGPEEVINMLCENDNIHAVPVALQEISDSFLNTLQERIKKQSLNFNRFVSGRNFVVFSRSMFGKKQVTPNMSLLNPVSYNFNRGGMTQEQKNITQQNIEKLKEEIQTVSAQNEESQSLLRSLKARKKSMNDEFHEVREKLIQNGANSKRKDKCLEKIKLLVHKIREREKAAEELTTKNAAQKSEEILGKITQLDEGKLLVINKLLDMLAKIQKNNEEIIELKLAKLQEQNKHEWVTELNRGIEEKKVHLFEEYQLAKEEYKKVREEYKNQVKDYKEKVSEFGEEMRTEVNDLYVSLQASGQYSMEYINGEIEKMNFQITRYRNVGSDVVARLKSNEDEIAKREALLPKYSKTVENLNNEMNKIDSIWRPQLETIVNKISEDFSDNLRAVASAGEVQLYKTDEGYSQWRLEILVKFRDSAELSILNTAQQSGGEKSATTAVFLNSLQGLTNTPFRIVDEINQGMDARNERLIHKLIVDKATKNKNSSQYFLITPKLLTNLHYVEGMTVHCILAGKWAPSGENHKDFLELGVTENLI